MGTLTVSGTVSGNTAIYVGGGIYSMAGTLNLSNTTVSGNTAFGNGGGIYNFWGPLSLSGTVSGNSAGWYGGGIYMVSGTWGALNVEIFGNRCDADDSGGETGGGIYEPGGSGSPAGVTYTYDNYQGSGATVDNYSN